MTLLIVLVGALTVGLLLVGLALDLWVLRHTRIPARVMSRALQERLYLLAAQQTSNDIVQEFMIVERGG